MSMIKTIATAGAVAAVGLGMSAASASAYGITGGEYTGTATSVHTFTVGGAYVVECDTATFTGTATGAATTAFTPSYAGCSFFGFPATVTQNGTWSLEVTSHTGTPPVFTGDLHIPASTSTVIDVPIAGCTVTVQGTQNFVNAGSAENVSPTGVELSASVGGISYTAVGCPFGSGNDGQYETNGVVSIPGITIDL